MNKTTLLATTAALLTAGTSAQAVLVSLSASGLYDKNGNVPTIPSRTIAVIDKDGDGLAGFNLNNWNGNSFLADPNDVIVTGDVAGIWSENTGDGDGFEALVPANIKNSVLDGSGTGYQFASADAAGNNASTIGEGDTVYLFYFPNLAVSATKPGANQQFGVINMGVLPGPSGSLTTSLISPSSNFLASFTTLGGSIPGDTDGDGDVDDADLGQSFANYTGPGGTGKTAAQGDTDGDGDVDDADLGTSFASYTGPLGPAVPEPTSLALISLAGLALTRRRRA